MEENIFEQSAEMERLKEAVEKLKSSIARLVVGQEEMVELLLAGLLADGHVLIEGVPGVAKTLTAKLLSKSLAIEFSRIQFTPDLMPSDVLGTSVFHPKEGDFHFKRGPIFSNIVLIDEINRAPAKTQAALFEVMEERQVTADGQTYPLDVPFLVIATQNPIEHEGTYQLPEAQLDRFLFKINVRYPNVDQEFAILENFHKNNPHTLLDHIEPVLSATQILQLRSIVRDIRVESHLLKYIAEIVHQTRVNKSLYLGASPRASLGILSAAKAIASMRGRDFIIPEDIVFTAYPVLRHRLVLTPEKEMEGLTTEDVIGQIISGIEIPR
jgi:MoxR-like ATPase